MADLGEEAFSSQMKVVATFLRLLEELMRNKQQDLRYGTKTQRRGILGRMKDFVGGIFKKVYDGTFGRLSRNGKDYGQLDLNDPAVAKLFADTMKQMGMDAMHMYLPRVCPERQHHCLTRYSERWSMNMTRIT